MTTEQIKAVASQARRASQLPHKQWLLWLHQQAKAQRKRTCQFCKKHPDQCKP